MKRENISLTSCKRIAQVACFWNQGFTIEVIANSLFMPVNTASSWVHRARELLGADLMPIREGGANVGDGRTQNYLDKLRVIGDTISVPKIDAGGRQNVHQNAQTRGWKVSLTSDGDNWSITAVRKTTLLSTVRREAASSKKNAKLETLVSRLD